MMEIKKWTVTDVADRFVEAASTLRRLPNVHVQRHGSHWPAIIHTALELWEQEKMPIRRGPPLPDAISRMEETIQWIFLIDDEGERRLVWLRAEKVRWRDICLYFCCGRTKAWQMWGMALLTIATRLNDAQKRNI
jgi:hypothetical protein